MVVAPHHDRFSVGKNALMLAHIANLQLHYEAGAAHMRHAHADLRFVGTNQREVINTLVLLDEGAVMRTDHGGLDARGMRALVAAMDQLILLARRPAIQVKLLKIIAARLLKIGEIDGIVHMSQRIKVAKTNLYWIPDVHEVPHFSLAIFFYQVSPVFSGVPLDLAPDAELQAA